MPYRSIEDPAKLRRALEATLLLAGDLELRPVLRHVLDEARSMTGARYAALGVLNEDHTALADFHTAGLDENEVRRIGSPPTGKGVLGLLITDPHPLRLASIGSHPDSYGFPPNHPSMTSFLGVPIKVRDEIYGNLYLTDKVGWSEFTQDDEALVEVLAFAAGIAIEHTRLHERAAETAVYEDRDRLARDLHDTVIQRLFAVGLSLQSVAGTAPTTELAERLSAAVSDIDDTIRQIRASIFELASCGPGIRTNVLSLLNELRPVVGFEVQASFDGPVDSAITGQIAESLLATLREAITNVARHASASESRVVLSVTGDLCHLEVIDNGRGFDEREVGEGGRGLLNMRSRAEKLGGALRVESLEAGGTLLTWQVPARG